MFLNGLQNYCYVGFEGTLCLTEIGGAADIMLSTQGRCSSVDILRTWWSPEKQLPNWKLQFYLEIQVES